MAKNTQTNFSDISLTEALADEIIEEPRPNMVASQFSNKYSIAGLSTKTKKLNRWNDPGRATAATEGTAFTTLTSLGTTALSVTPTEAAVFMTLTTDDGVETRIPGMESMLDVWQRGSLEQQLAAVMPEASMSGRACFEKMEYDHTALFPGFSRSAGNTGVDLSIADFDEALLTLESGEDLPHEGIVACLDKEQHGNIRKQLLVTSGGVAGSIWSEDLASIVRFRPDVARNGLKGALLGVPVYVHGVGARQFANSNADVVGAIFLAGTGAPEDGLGGDYGALAMVEKRKLQFSLEHDHRERGTEVQGNWKYSVVERADLWGVKFVSDAP